MFALATQLFRFAQDYTYSFPTSSTTDATSAFWSLFWIGMIIGLIAGIFGCICLWKIFQKAGQPGWAAIVPFYNWFVQCKIVGRESWGWTIFLCFVPFIGSLIFLVFSIIVYIDMAKVFGKSTGFAVLLILVPVVGLPILAFGKDRYLGPGAAMAGGMPQQPQYPQYPQQPPQGQPPVPPQPPMPPANPVG